jgi:hypothetical protein
MPQNSIQVWAVLHANGHSLYSSNVLENVEAEFERLIATDPRMRRVLKIVEQTMTFHPRDQPEPDPGDPQTVCVLPWLPLDERVLMGPLVFDHWSEARDQIPEPARTSANQLLGTFYDIHGNPIDPVIGFFADRSPTARLEEADRTFVRTSTFLLALAGLAENTYMHPAFEPMNAAHAQRLFVNFHAARPEIYAVRRRREGWAQSQWRSGGLRMMKPFAAEARPSAAGTHPAMTLYRQQFVDRLAECVGADDDLSHAICQSVVPFLRANDMDEYGAVEQDIVWLVAAFEQLLGLSARRIPGRRGAKLHIHAADVFVEHWQRQEITDCRRWLGHLRAKRNELHGRTADGGGWQSWAHALLASELFPLMVKALLAREGRYILDGIDLMKIEAFPAQVMLVAGDGPFNEQQLGEAWHQAASDAAARRVERNASTGDQP